MLNNFIKKIEKDKECECEVNEKHFEPDLMIVDDLENSNSNFNKRFYNFYIKYTENNFKDYDKVYVGFTADFERRKLEHYNDTTKFDNRPLIFKNIFTYFCNIREATFIESYFIIKYKLKYGNKCLNENYLNIIDNKEFYFDGIKLYRLTTKETYDNNKQSNLIFINRYNDLVNENEILKRKVKMLLNVINNDNKEDSESD
jgi:hypothetical protein